MESLEPVLGPAGAENTPDMGGCGKSVEAVNAEVVALEKPID
jgi:hypothetical protein